MFAVLILKISHALFVILKRNNYLCTDFIVGMFVQLHNKIDLSSWQRDFSVEQGICFLLKFKRMIVLHDLLQQ